MKEKNDFKDKLIGLMISNIVGFSLIFFVCGIFIFLMVRNITYKDIDNELLKSKELLLSIQENEDAIDFFFQKDFTIGIRQDVYLKEKNAIKSEIEKRLINPNVIIIKRMANGDILNSSELGRL